MEFLTRVIENQNNAFIHRLFSPLSPRFEKFDKRPMGYGLTMFTGIRLTDPFNKQNYADASLGTHGGGPCSMESTIYLDTASTFFYNAHTGGLYFPLQSPISTRVGLEPGDPIKLVMGVALNTKQPFSLLSVSRLVNACDSFYHSKGTSSELLEDLINNTMYVCSSIRSRVAVAIIDAHSG